MRKQSIITKLSLFCLLFLATTFKVNAQQISNVLPDYIFTADSIAGFDEDLAKQAAFNEGFFGDEFKVKMYYLKRDFIKAKYNISTPEPKVKPLYLKPFNTAKVAGGNCNNEDFEDAGSTSAVPGTLNITTTTGVPGWTITSGLNQGATASCDSKTLTGAPNACWVMSGGANGITDPVLGTAYKIWSVYGPTTTTYPLATAANGFQCYGDWVIKLNNNTGGYTAHQMKKNITVTPSNALFQFAFISVLQSSHCCCSSGGFSIKVKSGCAPSPQTQLACPQFTATAPQASYCSGGVIPCVYPTVGNTVTYLPFSGGNYNKWQRNTLDLTSYIGQCIEIEVDVFDCNAGGHYGYIYFDAQCSPMAVIGNGTSFPAGTPQITLPTCGTGNTATITAPSGLAPYSWAGPDILVNGSTAQTVTTSVTGQYTLTMTPPGSCAPIVRTIDVIISPAPNLIVSTQTQVACTNTVNGASFQFASGTPINTLTPQYVVSVLPSAPTATIGQTANTGTFTGFAVGVNTITITDSVGCTATTTLNFTGAPPVGSFSISAPSGTIIGCNPPSITLNAVNTGSLTNMTYTWTSTSTGTATGATWSGGAPTGTNVLTVFGSDMTVGSCPTSQTIAIAQNTAVPGVTVTPASRTITCNGAPATFTALTTTTTNITGVWYGPGGVALNSPSGTPLLLSAGSPGTYTVTFTNGVNGCSNSQTVSVAANTIVPTMSITANLGYQITCAIPCPTFAISASSGPAPISYTWTNLTTSVSTSPANGGYTVCAPGNYVAYYKDGNNCTVSQSITVTRDTARIFPTAITNLPSNTFTLTCKNDTLLATAISNPLLAANNYSWVAPGPSTLNSNTISINLSNVTNTTTGVTYTVQCTNPANGCVGKQKVVFNKDIAVPPYKAVFTPTAITCGNSCVFFSPALASGTSTIPVTYTFTSPAPTFTNNQPGSSFCAPGTYTMDYTNSINGCSATTSTVVPLNITPPSTVALAPVTIPCGGTVATITAGTTTTSTTYTYQWSGESATSLPVSFGNQNANTTTVFQPGTYDVVITNTVNGCSTTNSILVNAGVINAGIDPALTEGFSPLSVTLGNTTPVSSSSGTITTTWNYGNGTSVTTSSLASTYTASGLPSGSTVYQTAGSYTVLLIVSLNTGTTTCVGTATALVNVELPSDLTVPNVFTPNGDGVNDNFTLLTTNLTDITCTIFDRWGTKMYDVNADKGEGNISWDGKNFGGKEVPAGTYFYILKATGKDGKEYEQKGTISLYR